MKTSKRMVALAGVGMLLTLLANGVSGCGGGGGSDTPSTPVSSESLAEAALALLGNGDISGAQSSYDASLAADPENSQAAFGAAFTRMLLLPESSPAKTILGELGQNEFKVSNVVGPTGYLAALNVINKSEVAIDSIGGPFHGPAVGYNSNWTNTVTDYAAQDAYYQRIEDEYNVCVESCLTDDCLTQCEEELYTKYDDESSYTTVDLNCSIESVQFEYIDEDNSLQINGYLLLSAKAEKDGTILSSFELKEGDAFDLGASTGMRPCASDRIVSLWVRSHDNYYGEDYEEPIDSSGTLTLQKGESALGEGFELQLSNVVLTNWDGETLTLNGTLKDTITEKEPKAVDYFPFAEMFGGIKGGKVNVLFSRTRDGLTSAELVAEAIGFVPLFQEIKELLAQADRDNDFQFVVPKGLYFGNKDIPLNRIDLKGIRAGIDMALAGFYLADSWSFEIEVGSLYDEEGNKLYTLEEVAAQLNRFFELKSDNHLVEAQVEIAEGLQLVLDAHDLISEVTADGIVEDAPGTAAGYAELKDAVSIIQKSLSEQQIFPYVDPALTISLNSFFNNPPDASEIDIDPFVIEDGSIKPVEAFFAKLLEGTIDLDLTKTYRKAFTALEDPDLGRAVFDEFSNFFIAGRRLNKNF